jgi:hypothetical protein
MLSRLMAGVDRFPFIRGKKLVGILVYFGDKFHAFRQQTIGCYSLYPNDVPIIFAYINLVLVKQ